MLIMCIVFSAAFAAALIWVFLLKRDIRQLARKLGEIADTETNAHLTTDTFDKDITVLAESVNRTIERNQHDLYEKSRAESALKRAVTNISHDLRTPLTSAMGYLQMLETADLDIETRTRYLEIIHGRLEALSVLMNSLFEFSRIIEGSITINIQKVNVSNVLYDTLSASYSELDSKGFTVETEIPNTPVVCLCDEDALRRVLQNLIKNVYIHGREYMRVRLTDNAIEISNKTDNIKELDTERIFERFYTADASRTSKNTGLGFAIVKELLTRMNGKITANVEHDLLIIRVFLVS